MQDLTHTYTHTHTKTRSPIAQACARTQRDRAQHCTRGTPTAPRVRAGLGRPGCPQPECARLEAPQSRAPPGNSLSLCLIGVLCVFQLGSVPPCPQPCPTSPDGREGLREGYWMLLSSGELLAPKSAWGVVAVVCFLHISKCGVLAVGNPFAIEQSTKALLALSFKALSSSTCRVSPATGPPQMGQ